MQYTSEQFRRYTIRTAIYATLIIMTAFFLIPVYIVIITALKNPADINLATTWQPPTEIYWQSFQEVFNEFGPRIWNSVSLVLAGTVLSSVMGSMNGYVLAKWRIPGDKILFPLMLFGMFIPYQAILIPLFEFMRNINLYGGIPGLVLIHVVYGLPITTLIFRNFYVDIPDELLEAASIDGAGFFQIYSQVVFP
ncbi:MAG: carbohydrate ABC transporter permease, partial [Chloroflexi bacterium]